MKKILFVNASLTDGGSEKVMTLIANYLSLDSDFYVEMLALRDKEITYQLNKNINIHQLHDMNYRFIKKYLYRLLGMRKIIKCFSGEYIVSFMENISLMTMLASIGLNKKVILSIRNDPNRKDNKFFQIISKLYTLPKCYKVIFQTNQARSCYHKYIQNKGFVIPNPIDNKLPHPKNIHERKKLIISIGRLENQKNHEMTIKAFSKFFKIHPEYTLEIYGRGSKQKYLDDLIKELNMENSIFLKGFSNNIYDVLSKASIFVSSSNYEGISNTMLESLALGVPSICTDCPIYGARIIINNNVNGILISTNNEKELYDKMLLLSEDIKFSEYLSYNALKIRDLYSIEKIGNMWKDIFN